MGNDVIKELGIKAKEAAKKAYSPYSKVCVGSAVLTDDGEIFTGANIENVSFGGTVCAERVAIFKAVSAGKRKIKKIYVYSKQGWPPCGICRQVMSEFATDDLEVIIGDEKLNEKKIPFNNLLPNAFTPDKLDL